eukprot:1150478-Pelagomonas_calceolata.AAC.2
MAVLHYEVRQEGGGNHNSGLLSYLHFCNLPDSKQLFPPKPPMECTGMQTKWLPPSIVCFGCPSGSQSRPDEEAISSSSGGDNQEEVAVFTSDPRAPPTHYQQLVLSFPRAVRIAKVEACKWSYVTELHAKVAQDGMLQLMARF